MPRTSAGTCRPVGTKATDPRLNRGLQAVATIVAKNSDLQRKNAKVAKSQADGFNQSSETSSLRSLRSSVNDLQTRDYSHTQLLSESDTEKKPRPIDLQASFNDSRLCILTRFSVTTFQSREILNAKNRAPLTKTVYNFG